MENIRGDEFRAGFRVVLDRETKNPHVVHHPPPLTAIDRFLLSSSSSEKQISPTELCGSSSTTINSFGGAVDGNGYLSLPSLTDISFVDGLLVDGNSDNFRNDGHKMKKISKRLPESSLSMPTSPIFIKGQWTDGEDRLLVRLVKQYGERKWAQIAHKLGGRAGKQCRERWHNHLRPDIKKDTWSEEEERLLVETHQKVGNRWAEIAKRIPGRTENSIKNHWNATKRRLNSRRKNNKRTAAKSKASFLQSYINGSCIKENILSSSSSSTTTTLAITEPPNGIFLNSSNQLSSVLHPEPSSNSSFTDDSPLTLVAQTHDDELLFIQKFFEDIYSKQQLVSSSLVHNKTQIGHENTPTYDYGYGHRNSSVFDIDSSSLQTLKYGDPPAMGIYNDHEFMVNVSSTSPSTDFTNFYTANNTIQDAHDYSGGSTESCSINSCSTTNSSTHVNSDLYISYLLNEVGSFSSSNNNTSESQCYHGHPDSFMDYLWTDGRGSYHTPMKRDMDLIEMVSFSNYSGSHD